VGFEDGEPVIKCVHSHTGVKVQGVNLASLGVLDYHMVAGFVVQPLVALFALRMRHWSFSDRWCV
jgi:hypothetical protein